jgi:16S rRNA (cytosine1402-N4)-methyltransferase
MSAFHEPVLLRESVDFLVTDSSGTYVDATFGGGGHTLELLSRLNSKAKVMAFDVDRDSRGVAVELSASEKRLSFFPENFSHVRDALGKLDMGSCAGFLFDLGVSSHQIDAETGFSYKRADKLDMRMDKNLEVSAYDIVNSYSAERLEKVFSKYAEEPHSRRLARAILNRRAKNKIETTFELAHIIDKVCGKSVKTLSRIFQALRIEVNDELGSLSEGLKAAFDLTSRGGRIVVISYHSLEDRIVKEKFKFEAATCICPPQTIICNCGKAARARILTRKPILPGREEIVRNGRARSAKMRAAEKIV